MGNVQDGSRNTAQGSLLKWKLAMPLSEPEVEIVPFMVDWSETEAHPTDEMPDMHCELVHLHAAHPDPERCSAILENLGLVFQIEESSEIQLNAVIKCPKGLVTI